MKAASPLEDVLLPQPRLQRCPRLARSVAHPAGLCPPAGGAWRRWRRRRRRRRALGVGAFGAFVFTHALLSARPSSRKLHDAVRSPTSSSRDFRLQLRAQRRIFVVKRLCSPVPPPLSDRSLLEVRVRGVARFCGHLPPSPARAMTHASTPPCIVCARAGQMARSATASTRILSAAAAALAAVGAAGLTAAQVSTMSAAIVADFGMQAQYGVVRARAQRRAMRRLCASGGAAAAARRLRVTAAPHARSPSSARHATHARWATRTARWCACPSTMHLARARRPTAALISASPTTTACRR